MSPQSGGVKVLPSVEEIKEKFADVVEETEEEIDELEEGDEEGGLDSGKWPS